MLFFLVFFILFGTFLVLMKQLGVIIYYSHCQCNYSSKEKDRFRSLLLEATPGFEPGVKVLQTSALPLGYVAIE